MADALASRGHEVHVVTYHLGEPYQSTAFQIHRIPVVPTYRKYSPGPTYQKLLLVDSLLARKLGQVLRKHKIDLIHAHHYEGLLVSLLARRWAGPPIIFDAHTLLESELPFYRIGMMMKTKQRVGRALDSWLPKKAAHIIVVTEDIRSKLVQQHAVHQDKITVISNGVEIDHFDVEPRDPSKRNGQVKTLVFAGNLSPYQGIELLLEALRLVLESRSDVQLVIASDDSFAPYEALASRLGVRRYVKCVPSGFDTLPECLADADIALNPRIVCDGIPQKLLNYMAAGKPIVSFAGSAKELEHGRLGLVVEDGNASAFAQAIQVLLSDLDLRETLARNCREFVRQNRSWEETARNVEMVYAHVLGCAAPDWGHQRT